MSLQKCLLQINWFWRSFMASTLLLLPLSANAETVSSQTSAFLRTRRNWISVSSNYLPGAQKILTPVVVKKWKVESGQLIEVTENSVQLNSNKTKEWFSEKVDISGEIAFDRIATTPFGASPNFNRLSASAFSISTPNAVVVFRASNANYRFLPPTKGDFVHMWAPVAASLSDLGIESSWDLFPATPHARHTALRHDLSKSRVVKVSASYPRSLLPALQKAIRQWNRALHKNYYVVGDTSMRLTQEECFASRDLCIFWQGSPDLAWANYGAVTAITYDPAVGYILGSVVTIYNLAPQKPTQVVPADIMKGLDYPEGGPYVAASVWAQPQYRDYINPEPLGSITALLVHEMGHDQGFRHYFGGSLHAVAGKPSDTVMDYMPYPYFSHMQELGARDLAKVEALYRGGEFGSGFSTEMPCSDGDTLINPLCNPQDIGDPAIFYTSIVQSLGAFQMIKPSGGFSGVFNGPAPAVDFAARFLQPQMTVTTFQRALVKNAICSSSDKIEILAHLLTLPSPIKLDCEANLNSY